ncbi:MAG: type II toxin-antitoxin system Phd/YefM family antitoxin [Planctomycetes bacterium]|nr:type II toxin-antitoxin system Phd/YefM family antitoxin [Planctomycetota bacterium]
MNTISIEEAQSRLSAVIHELSPGQEVVITEDDQPVARLVSVITLRPQRKLGTLRGTVLHVAPDFDAPLDDFQDYMQ